MKTIHILSVLLVILLVSGCENDKPKAISASATATKNKSGEIVVRDSTRAEKKSVSSFHEKIMRINDKYPPPPVPIKKETFKVIEISDEGIFKLENGTNVKMSGILCNSGGVYFIRKIFDIKTEKLALIEEDHSSNGVIEAYIWQVDYSMMNDPEFKQYEIGPSFSGLNDNVILNNWCEIEPESESKYYSRYLALERISQKSSY